MNSKYSIFHTNNTILRSLALLTLVLFQQPVAHAQTGDSWQFKIAPYLWAAGQEGTVATLNAVPPADIDLSFSDIIKDLDFALMGIAEARKGRFGIFGEIFFTKVSPGAKTPGPAFSKVKYDQELWSISAGGLFALSQAPDHNIDAVIGIRRWDLDNKMTFETGILPGFKSDKQQDWSDVFIGLKGRKALNDRWYVNGWGYAAIGGDSDSYWDLFGGVGYNFSSFSLDVGYRHQEIDYDNNGFLYDVKISGPIVGFVFDF
jgi:hypothetical protein